MKFLATQTAVLMYAFSGIEDAKRIAKFSYWTGKELKRLIME